MGALDDEATEWDKLLTSIVCCSSIFSSEQGLMAALAPFIKKVQSDWDRCCTIGLLSVELGIS